MPVERQRQGGFTILELLIALTVLIIGLTGIMALQMTSMRAAAYSRHATEASVLAEDKMEALRTAPLVAGTTVEGPMDAQGLDDAEGLYTRTIAIVDNGVLATIEVKVEWKERGEEDHSITVRTQRAM
jgi:type IV pilus assembly protein PilV